MPKLQTTTTPAPFVGVHARVRWPLCGEDMEFLDYVEQEAKTNMHFHLDTLEALNKEAHTLLSLQLLFAGAAFGYTMSLFGGGVHPAVVAGSVALVVYLCVVGATTAVRCLMHTPLEAPANEPANLLLDDIELDDLRLAELDNIQVRIDRNRDRNARTGKSLNTLRILTLAAPVVFGIIAGVSYLFF